MSANNGTGRNAKGEDYGKFIKEISSPEFRMVARKLNKMSSLPKNRAEARAKGFDNVEEAIKKQAGQIRDREEFRAHKINKWFDDQLLRYSPRLFLFAKRIKKPWLFKWLGFRFEADDRNHYHSVSGKPFPYTYVSIHWLWWLKTERNLFWEKPDDPALNVEGE